MCFKQRADVELMLCVESQAWPFWQIPNGWNPYSDGLLVACCTVRAELVGSLCVPIAIEMQIEQRFVAFSGRACVYACMYWSSLMHTSKL